MPNLRFPEFLDTGEWNVKQLGEVAENLDSKRVPITENERVKGDIPYYGASGVIDHVKDFIFDEDLLCISEDGANLVARTYPIAFSITGKTWVNNHAHVLKFDKNFTQVIVEKYLNSINLEDFLTGMAQPKLNRGQLDIIPIPLPKPDEQQKITDCLSSIDELILAQSQKIDALKAHKKGLMQQLFPAEGETVPKLRFAEFRDKGEWEENTLGGAGTFINGKAYQQEELLDNGKYRVLRVGNFFTNKEWYYSDLELEKNKYCDKGDLLYAWSASFGPRIWSGEKVIYHYHIWKVIEKKGIAKKFLFFLLEGETDRIKAKQANGLGLLHITKNTIEGWECRIPKIEEQQKIADCLSSLDELISAQSQKLDALKVHKKGLMQGLFPCGGDPAWSSNSNGDPAWSSKI